MGREIKFRAWHPTSGMALTPILQRSDYTGIVRCEGYDKEGNSIDLPLMQYTGLKDSTGNDIWEGDIVSISYDDGDIMAVVKWSEDDATFFTAGINMGEYPICLNSYYANRCSVIGNIHENPELMTQ